MLKNLKEMKGFKILAKDTAGETIGTVKDVFFDDESWAVRYLAVDTRVWLFEDVVLISPYNINGVDWDDGIVWVNLSKMEIEHSPKAPANKPITRKFETTFNNYFKLPHYWSNGLGMDIEGLWAGSYFPARPVEDAQSFKSHAQPEINLEDKHLHSMDEVLGFHLRTVDDESFGAVVDLVIEVDSWALRYIVFDTHKFLPGGKLILLSPEWVERFDWENKKIITNSLRHTIEQCPAYDPTVPLERAVEEDVHNHFDRIGYWNLQGWDNENRGEGDTSHHY